MRFADELVDESKFNFPSAKAIRSKKELEMAKSLVEGLSDKWNPEQYTDEYRANLMTIIEAKLKGKEAKVEISEETRGAEVIDVSKLSGKQVMFGATITVVDEDTDERNSYQIVGPDEADVKAKRLSITSPLARAVIGKKVGDTVEVTTPNGSKSYEIVKVAFK